MDNNIPAPVPVDDIISRWGEGPIWHEGRLWYVDIEGKHSGYGVPADNGWIWTEDNSIAPRVRSAIEIQARRAAPTFVELPLASGSPGTAPETK